MFIIFAANTCDITNSPTQEDCPTTWRGRSALWKPVSKFRESECLPPLPRTRRTPPLSVRRRSLMLAARSSAARNPASRAVTMRARSRSGQSVARVFAAGASTASMSASAAVPIALHGSAARIRVPARDEAWGGHAGTPLWADGAGSSSRLLAIRTKAAPVPRELAAIS